MKRYLPLLLILLSCSLSKDRKVYEDVDPSWENVELYFFQDTDFIKLVSSSMNLDLIDGFKISDEKVVKQIVETWAFPKATKWNGYPVYKLELSVDKKTYSSKSINESMSIISSHGEFLSFDKSELMKYRDHFLPLGQQKIRISKRKDAISFLKVARKNGGYLRFNNSEKLIYPFEKWPGKMTIEYPQSLIPESEKDPFDYVVSLLSFETEVINANLLLNELSEDEKKIDPSKDAIKQLEEIDRREHEGARVLVEFYCNQVEPESLPANFSTIEQWHELESIEYAVYNLTAEELVKIGIENSIKVEIIKN